MKIKWTKEALNNLETIYNFIHHQNPTAAIKIFNGILEEIDILESFPQIAPIEQLLQNEPEYFRSFIILKGRFKVIYYIEEDFIYITHIWDCRQNPKTFIKSIK